jgi:WD40 repeat protein
MPTPEPPFNHRYSPPFSIASYRGRDTTVAETGTTRQSRKKGKHAAQKETNPAREPDSDAIGEQEGYPPFSRVENANTRPSKVSTPSDDLTHTPILGALRNAETMPDLDNSALTATWAQSIPFAKPTFTNQPHGSNASGSPPKNTNAAVERGGFSGRSPPSSPPTHNSRPASSGFGISPPQVRQPQSNRSLSVQPPFSASSPPRPHLPQAHFYGAPNLDLGLGARLRDPDQDQGVSCLSFTRIPAAVGSKRQKYSPDSFLMAAEDKLDIVTLEKSKLSALGALEGVGGTIIDAKVLTWQSRNDPFHHLRPLVSLVVHGPARIRQPPQDVPDLVPDREVNPTDNAGPGVKSGSSKESTDFQTTVEIYSLATQNHLSTLMWSQPTRGLPNFRGRVMSVPPPVGSLKLDAGGNFLTVSSGTSGEIFVFTVDEHSTARFRCLGKIWTTAQTLQDRRYSESGSSTDTDTSPADVNRGAKLGQFPIISLSSRWLAVVPPEPVSCQALPLTVAPDTISSIVPGLESRNAPPQPPVSCAIESPDAESLINRVARGVAQEVVRGARWLGGQGYQSWNSYWNKDQTSGTQAPSPNRNVYPAEPYVPAGFFPPTHAPEVRPTSAEPQLVSVIDLEMLARESHPSTSERVMPLATFQPPNGVSFLSFSPDGLSVLSATRKGDVQYVWDLKQIRHLRAGILLANPETETTTRSGKVSQVARFARLTPSCIVDIEWKDPSGDQLAIITKNGTIHVFDVPLQSLQWPPIRRPTRQTEPYSAPASPAVTAQADEPTVIGGVLSSAIKLAGKTQPMLANLRGRAPSLGMINAGGGGNNGMAFASATGARGSKAVAAGLSKSVGAATGAVSSLRHAGDNRLHLVSLAKNPARSRVSWSQNPHQSIFLVLDGQSIKSYRVSRNRSTSKPRRQALSVIDVNPRLNLSLPASEQLSKNSAMVGTAISRPSAPNECRGGENALGGYWNLPPSARNIQSPGIVHPLSCAEIETNAPYQPFHSDRRVSLSVYHGHRALGHSHHKPWVFGNDVATTRLDIRAPRNSEDDQEHNGPETAHDRVMHRQGDGVAGSTLYRHTSMTSGGLESSTLRARTPGDGGGDDDVHGLADQIVVTTRRRKNLNPAAGAKGKGGAGYQSTIVGGSGAGPRAVATAVDGGAGGAEDGFFEDDCDVLDFAEDRV